MTSKNKASSKPHAENVPSPDAPDARRAEETLREYQSILSAAEEVAKIGSWRWDLRTQKVTWSDEMFRLFGVEREGFDGDLSRVITERIHPDDTDAVNEANRRVMEEVDPRPMSYRILLPDGTVRTVWAQGKMVYDANDQPQALTGFVQDITERIVAEKKILQMKRLYATLSQVNQMIVRVKGRDELFQTICDVAVQFGELSLAWISLLDEPTGKVQPVASSGLELKDLPLPSIRIHKAEYENSLTAKALQTSKVMTSENIVTDSRIASFNSHFQPCPYRAAAIIPFRLRSRTIGVLVLLSNEIGIFKDEDEIRLLDEMGLDISFALDNMENDKERRIAEERFASAFRSSPAPVTITRVSDGRIVDVNDAWSQAFGYTHEQAVGHTSIELGITDAKTRQQVMDALKETGVIRNIEARVTTHSMERRDMLLSMEMIDLEGEPHSLTTLIDITERKHAEKKVAQMKRLYATLSQVNQMIVRVREHDELFQTICNVAVKFGEFNLAWVGLLDNETGDLRPRAANGLDVRQWPFPLVNINKDQNENSLAVNAIRTSQVMVSEHIQGDERVQGIVHTFQQHSYQALAVVPFSLRGKTIGVLSLVSEEKGLFQDEEEIRLLDEIGLDISFALDNLENEKERKQAEAQIISLSKFPEENPNPVLRITREGVLLYANQGSQVLLDFWKCSMGSPLPEELQDVVANVMQDGRTREMKIKVNGDAVFAINFVPVAEGEYVNVYGRDITEREQAEEALQLANARFQRMVDSNIVGIVVAEANGKLLLANDYYLSLLNLTRQDFMHGKVDWRKFTPPEWLPADEKAIRELREKGVSEPYEKEYVRADGTRVSVLIADALFAGPEEQIIGFILDITERKKAEQASYESEYRYRNLVETSPDGIFINRENQIVFMNSRGLEMLGATTQEQVLGKSPFDIFHPDSHSLIQERIKLLLNEKTAVPAVEERLIRLDGTVLPAEVTAAPVMVDGVLAIQVVLRDITERKRAQEQVKQNERVLRLFVEHSPASIAMFDREMKYIVASHRYLIDYRLSIQDLTGRSHYDIFPEIPERWKEIHRRCLNGEIIKADEDPFPREDGTLDWVRWEIHPWYEETGNIGGIILFSEVITERKQVQDELHLLNLQLEQRVRQRTLELSQANRAKDEFLANMSHELRTPLNTVLGLSETLLEQHKGPLNEKQAQSIELIASSGRHLLGLINDILEVSKIEAGKLELHPTRVYIKELCESSLNFIKEIAFKKRIDVELNQEELISTLFADPQRLKQILINLLINAVKFTPDGGRIRLDVYTNADRDRIMFSVSDTGIGIADQDLKKLFTPFTQLDSSLSRQYAGTGLGLALVQKLTDLQGGSVEVESEIGKGSRFTIILPLNQAQDESIAQGLVSRPKMEAGSTAVTNTNPQPITVLLAEDNEINAQMIAEYLEAHNYKVFVSEDGEAVLQRARETSPRIILMDIQMPKMDGLEAIRHLRADARFASTPIIALTALAMPGDRERCIQAGANEYLSKPVSLKKLVEIIQNLTSR